MLSSQTSCTCPQQGRVVSTSPLLMDAIRAHGTSFDLTFFQDHDMRPPPTISKHTYPCPTPVSSLRVYNVQVCEFPSTGLRFSAHEEQLDPVLARPNHLLAYLHVPESAVRSIPKRTPTSRNRNESPRQHYSDFTKTMSRLIYLGFQEVLTVVCVLSKTEGWMYS